MNCQAAGAKLNDINKSYALSITLLDLFMCMRALTACDQEDVCLSYITMAFPRVAPQLTVHTPCLKPAHKSELS